MNRKLLHTFAGLGLATLLGAGCVVSSDDDDGSAGASGSAGSGTGGSGGGTGGTAGTGGGTGGTAGSAGAAGAAGAGGSGFMCTPMDPTFNACESCRDEKCCTEWLDCLADGEPCSEGGLMSEGEIICIQDCVLEAFMMDPAADPVTVKASCQGTCATDGTLITMATNQLFACLDDPTNGCPIECFGQ